ncbi:MAG: RlmE family RNA methyltransferase [Deltaproteobacteria bacterium]|nr:RlmE family RNA methyltransferase [Deltaproteobacteria bacterium]
MVDLGCSPGSWLQYLAEKVGERGVVIGYDLVPTKVSLGGNVHTFVADASELSPLRIEDDLARALGVEDVEAARAAKRLRADAVLSDMAPKTTGIRDADQARSIGLVEGALALALELLTPRGVFVAKVFQGRGFDALMNDVRRQFREVRALKPEATRQGSREAFIVAKTRR